MFSVMTKRAAMSTRASTASSSAALMTAMLLAVTLASSPSALANTAPVANAGPPVTIAMPMDNATFTGSATDDGLPAGSALTLTWEFVNGPPGPANSPGAVLSATTGATTTARFTGGPGTYTFNFNASDGELVGTSTLTVTVEPNVSVYPGAIDSTVDFGWERIAPAAASMNEALLNQARDYSLTAGVTGNEAGYIIRGGRLVYSWGNVGTRFEMKSTTKSIGGLALLLGLDEGNITLADKAAAKLPVFGIDPPVTVTAGSLADISVLQLATHTAGFSKSDAPQTLQLNFVPGSTWSYSDQGLNWLADVLTQTYATDLNALLGARVYAPLGITATDLTWRDNAFRSVDLSVNGTPVRRREFASGINANVNAMARLGLLMLRQGAWGNLQILSNGAVATAHTPPAEVATATISDPAGFPGATTNYGVLWWTNATGQMAGVPADAYWAWGLHETLIVVVPSLDLVIARAGDRSWRANPEDWNADYNVLQPFIAPIVQSVIQ